MDGGVFMDDDDDVGVGFDMFLNIGFGEGGEVWVRDVVFVL